MRPEPGGAIVGGGGLSAGPGGANRGVGSTMAGPGDTSMENETAEAGPGADTIWVPGMTWHRARDLFVRWLTPGPPTQVSHGRPELPRSWRPGG